LPARTRFGDVTVDHTTARTRRRPQHPSAPPARSHHRSSSAYRAWHDCGLPADRRPRDDPAGLWVGDAAPGRPLSATCGPPSGRARSSRPSTAHVCFLGAVDPDTGDHRRGQLVYRLYLDTDRLCESLPAPRKIDCAPCRVTRSPSASNVGRDPARDGSSVAHPMHRANSGRPGSLSRPPAVRFEVRRPGARRTGCFACRGCARSLPSRGRTNTRTVRGHPVA
jgi:hypothetical protein